METKSYRIGTYELKNGKLVYKKHNRTYKGKPTKREANKVKWQVRGMFALTVVLVANVVFAAPNEIVINHSEPAAISEEVPIYDPTGLLGVTEATAEVKEVKEVKEVRAVVVPVGNEEIKEIIRSNASLASWKKSADSHKYIKFWQIMNAVHNSAEFFSQVRLFWRI